jgi:ABC-type antimicrobial peptide transport system permease subunit
MGHPPLRHTRSPFFPFAEIILSFAPKAGSSHTTMAMIASYLLACRAMKVNPIEALK